MTRRVLDTPSAPKALGPYSVAVGAGDLVFVSGQVGIDPASGEPASDDVGGQARQIMTNIAAILADVGLGTENIVKSTIFLADINDFGTVNDIYAEHFEDAPPARSTVQAAGLPGGHLVEIEVIASREETE